MDFRHLALAACLAPGIADAQNAAPPSSPLAVPTAADAGVPVKLRVLAKGNGRPVARVEVKLGSDRQLTNKDGEVVLTLPPGDVKVEIYRAGYERLTLGASELRGTGAYDVYLYPATPVDNEVIVRGNRHPEVSRKTVAIEEAAAVAPGGDPAQIPKLLPGVQSNSFSPDIVVRGSGPNDSAYRVDNWELPYIFHRIGNISVMPLELLSDVDFSSGGFGVQYGDVTGGVVDLRTKSEVPDHASTSFVVNLPIYSGIFYERPVDDGKDMVAISARRSYLDAFLPTILRKTNSDLTVVPYFGDAHVFFYHPQDDGFVKVLALYSYDGLKAAFPSGSASTDQSGRGEFNLFTGASMLGLEWKKTLDKDWTVTASPEVLNTVNNTDVVGNSIHINAAALGLRGEAQRRLGGKDKLYLGVDTDLIYAQAHVLAPRFNGNDPFFDLAEAPKVQTDVAGTYVLGAVYAAVDQTFGDFTVTPGVRPFYATQNKRSGVDPRVSARYALTKEHSLKAAVGQYSETPQFQETDTNFGNPHLKFIRSYQYVLGVESNWGELWTTDFEAYYKTLEDEVRSDPVTHTNNSGSGYSYGLEAFVRRNLTERLFGWISYTYSINRERDSATETFRHSQYDQTHVVDLTGNYKLTAVWALGGRFNYHTGDTYTGIGEGVYNANLDKYQARPEPTGRLYDKRLPQYNELDVFADKTFLYDTWKLTWRFGVEYLAFGGPQAQGVQSNYDYTKTEYFRGVPPIPYMELRGTL